MFVARSARTYAECGDNFIRLYSVHNRIVDKSARRRQITWRGSAKPVAFRSYIFPDFFGIEYRAKIRTVSG